MPEIESIFLIDEDIPYRLRPKSERNKIVEAARRMYSDDDVEIDDEAAFSEADEHVWVSAWVRVPLPLEDHEAP